MSRPAIAEPRRAALPLRRWRTMTLAERQAWLAWLFLLPALLVVIAVAMIPLAQTLYFSFTDKRLGALEPEQWVGLENYRFLLSDSLWWTAVKVTVQFTVITVALEFLLGLLIALVVNSRFPGRGPMRAAMLVPWAILSYFHGQTFLAIKLVILYGVLSLVRQLLEAKVVADNVGLHPLATLLAIYAGFQLWGALGVILGPILLIAIQAVIKTGISRI